MFSISCTVSSKQNNNTVANANIPFHRCPIIEQCKVNEMLEQIVNVLKTRPT